ncbi:MAG: hypothetical protein J6S67_06590 [Methanobrevibacter sp.]|nr:hypothetical protein [Methanobrevibacter sp.]
MTREFTCEEFTGYKFLCETTDANVGFKHICKVLDVNGEEVKGAKSVINWGNRTWEGYQYQSVFESSKSKLAEILEGNKEEAIELDYGFLYNLINYDYIHDYAEDESGDTYIMVDTWSQVEEGSVWDKLVQLAKKGMLKPSINKTMLALEREFVFTDEYTKCDECGKLINTQWGEGKFIEDDWYYGYYCNDCINSNSEIIDYLVEEAKEDFEKAVPVEVSKDIIGEMGYAPILNETYFSFMRDNWTADTYITEDKAKEICETFGGFVKLGAVQQFDVLFHIFVPVDELEEAEEMLEN